MRIAQISPLFEAVPPKLYGGTERVVYSLTEELVAMGHDVTLFASGDSITSATLAPMRAQALRLDPTVIDWVAIYMQMIERIYRRADEFDVLHFHIDYFPLSLFSRQQHAVPDHAARPARPAGVQGHLRAVSRRAVRLDLQQPAPADPAPELGRAPCCTACRPRC